MEAEISGCSGLAAVHSAGTGPSKTGSGYTHRDFAQVDFSRKYLDSALMTD